MVVTQPIIVVLPLLVVSELKIIDETDCFLLLGDEHIGNLSEFPQVKTDLAGCILSFALIVVANGGGRDRILTREHIQAHLSLFFISAYLVSLRMYEHLDV